MSDTLLYPSSPSARDRWILAHRRDRAPLDAERPYAFHQEQERAADGRMESVNTIFLTNRECPWRCVMCDLWKNTLSGTVSDGAIPRQISFALRQLPPATCVKLYNSGSFFDPHAIPPTDHQEIADRVADYDRVIVESHPALIGEASLRFRDLLKGKLEVAMGLETVHPVGLEKLNKRLSVSQFAHAASYLREHGIGLRAFVLVHPPFVALDDAVYWDQRSIDFAFQSGADTVSLILTRAGNGAMDRLIESGDFTPPPLDALEAALDYGIRLGRGRVFADLWDLSSSLRCEACASSRINRLRRINDTQLLLAPPTCPQCGESR